MRTEKGRKEEGSEFWCEDLRIAERGAILSKR
jgi:hypothetical protein